VTNPNPSRLFEGTARRVMLALAIPLLLLALPAEAQFANDGAKQNLAGGWDPDWGFCTQDPPPGPGSASRNDCRSVILSAGTNVAGNPYWNPAYDSQAKCLGTPPNPLPPGGVAEWTSSSNCTNYWLNGSQALCEGGGGMWLNNICRGRWRWNPEAPANSAANYRDNCTRCHNQKYSNFSEWGNGDHYVMTGHKNMLRPVAPLGNTDPHYTTGAPWAGSSGEVYATDSSGNPIDFSTGTITVGGVTKTLYFLYGGWVAATPRSIAAGGSYTCARCHTTGWSSDATMNLAKEPAKMFGDYTGLFSTAADGGAYTSWDVYGISCARCHGSRVALETPDVRHHPNIAGKEATGGSATGATRVALCMDCHRQETGGQPYPGQDTDPGGVLKVGPSHESVEFVSS